MWSSFKTSYRIENQMIISGCLLHWAFIRYPSQILHPSAIVMFQKNDVTKLRNIDEYTLISKMKKIKKHSCRKTGREKKHMKKKMVRLTQHPHP